MIVTEKILGIDFLDTSSSEVIDLLSKGGLLVVPSGPGLATIPDDKLYYKSLIEADYVIPDSGYMVLLWQMLGGKKINRISGLEFLLEFFNDNEVKNASFLLVDPREKEATLNQEYLVSRGFKESKLSSYLAPIYSTDKVEDQTLLDLIEKQKPRYVLINIGGGIQEKLGAYLRRNLDFKPAIICTGAAIAFLTGQQATIPTWADRLFIGWLLRCISNPKVFVPRYFKAFKLATLMVKYRETSPFA
jgi:N-acetylglucosaminyldiphosphoundecaprenol N-acetyl-beta-D-mannosaminyltransferase